MKHVDRTKEGISGGFTIQFVKPPSNTPMGITEATVVKTTEALVVVLCLLCFNNL
jgi:hypothetical protein